MPTKRISTGRCGDVSNRRLRFDEVGDNATSGNDPSGRLDLVTND